MQADPTCGHADSQGAFLGQLQLTAAGQYSIDVVQAASATSWLNFSTSVAPGSVLPGASYALGGGLFAGTVGQTSNLTVRMFGAALHLVCPVACLHEPCTQNIQFLLQPALRPHAC